MCPNKVKNAMQPIASSRTVRTRHHNHPSSSSQKLSATCQYLITSLLHLRSPCHFHVFHGTSCSKKKKRKRFNLQFVKFFFPICPVISNTHTHPAINSSEFGYTPH